MSGSAKASFSYRLGHFGYRKPYVPVASVRALAPAPTLKQYPPVAERQAA